MRRIVNVWVARKTKRLRAVDRQSQRRYWAAGFTACTIAGATMRSRATNAETAVIALVLRLAAPLAGRGSLRRSATSRLPSDPRLASEAAKRKHRGIFRKDISDRTKMTFRDPCRVRTADLFSQESNGPRCGTYKIRRAKPRNAASNGNI